MASKSITPTVPDGQPVDSQRTLRRAVLGGSLGTSALLGVILAFTGPGETAPAAAPAPENAPAELAPGAETYPIPPRAAGETPSAPPVAAVEKEAPPTSTGTSPAHKADGDTGKGGRNHAATSKQAGTKGDPRSPRGRGTVATGPARPETATTSDEPAFVPAPEVKKRMPLVDDQSRVRILE